MKRFFLFVKRFFLLVVLAILQFFLSGNSKHQENIPRGVFEERRWTGTITFEQRSSSITGTSERYVTVNFNSAWPTLHRDGVTTTDFNFTDDKGTGSETFHAEARIEGKLIGTTDCQGSGQTELHIVDIDNESYYIHAIGPSSSGTESNLIDGTTRTVEPYATDITISERLGTTRDILDGAKTETADMGAGVGTVTTTITWHLVRATDTIDEPCTACGSVIGIENQTLGQAIAIVGTPFTLNYRSDNNLGRNSSEGFGGWTLSSHHSLLANRIYFGNGQELAIKQNLKPITEEIPGVVPAGGHLVASADDAEIYAFDGAGSHLRTFDALTGALICEFQYDVKKKLTAVVDAYGLATTIERKTNNLPSAIISPHGHRTNMEYDKSNNLTSIINPSGEKYTFAYSAGGLLIHMIDPRDFSHTYDYDATGRLIRNTDPSGGFTKLSLARSTSDYTVILSTASGLNTKYRVIDKAGGKSEKIVTFPDGSKNSATKWSDGRSTIEFGDGTVVTRINKPDKRWGMQASLPAITVKLPSGLTSTLTTTRNATQTNPLNPLTLSGLTETYSINGRAFTMNYSASDKTFKLSSPSGRSILAVLDDNGRITRAQANGMAEVSVTYDKNGRPSIIEQGPASNLRRYQLTYNSEGYLKSIADPLDQTNSFIYDAAGRITQSILPDGRILAVRYDATGNLTSFTPAGRPAHGFEYDKTNHITKYFPPDVRSGQNATGFEYNADHQVTAVIRPDGQTINLAYDPGGCSCGKLATLSTPTGKTIFSYHPTTGKLSSITSPGNIKLAQTYDGPLLTSETWSGPIEGSVTRRYNSDHQTATYSVNGAQVITNTYDSDGLLTKAGELVITRSPKDIQTSTTTLNDVKESWKYNEFGEIVKSEAKYKGISLLDIDYTRDGLGRISTMLETIGGVIKEYRYGYDKAGRLVSVSKNGAANSSYSYDSNDNFLNGSGPNGVITGKYDDQDRIITFGNRSFTFTDNGELLTQTSPSGTTTYKYDVFGNLLRVTLPDSKLIEYLVDGRNRRIGKKVNGTSVKGFVYLDGLRIAAELDGNSRVVTRFIYGTRYNLPDYMIRNGVKYRIIADHLNSPRLVVDVQTGKIIQQLDYDEFGNILVDTEPGFQPFGFAGGLYDNDSKLTRFGARDYDASTGRWTTKDPIRFRGMSSNFYQYAAGDPVNRVDPLGLQGPLPEYGEAVCSWDEGRKKADREAKAIDSFRGTDGERYGWETEGGNEIDMRHYTAAYNTTQRLGGKGSSYAFWASQLLGLFVEVGQCMNDSKSAFNPSDFLSNFIGALDAFQGNTPLSGTPSGRYGYLKF